MSWIVLSRIDFQTWVFLKVTYLQGNEITIEVTLALLK